MGAGVGLDLAEVKGIIEEHNGWIIFSSQEIEYTEFNLFLPVAGENQSHQ